MLAGIGFVLRDAGARAALARRAPAEEILAEVRRVEASFEGPMNGHRSETA